MNKVYAKKKKNNQNRTDFPASFKKKSAYLIGYELRNEEQLSISSLVQCENIPFLHNTLAHKYRVKGEYWFEIWRLFSNSTRLN